MRGNGRCILVVVQMADGAEEFPSEDRVLDDAEWVNHAHGSPTIW